MKFRNISNTYMHDVYGYEFPPGVVVDVKEINLCAKFINYGWTEEVSDGVQEQGEASAYEGADAAAEAGPLSRDELKAALDAEGIEYSAKARTTTLQGLLDGCNQNTAGE